MVNHPHFCILLTISSLTTNKSLSTPSHLSVLLSDPDLQKPRHILLEILHHAAGTSGLFMSATSGLVEFPIWRSDWKNPVIAIVPFGDRVVFFTEY